MANTPFIEAVKRPESRHQTVISAKKAITRMCGKAQPDGRPDSIETRLQISPFVD